MDTVPRKTYPRAIPHRAPDEINGQPRRLRAEMAALTAQAARQRRWNYMLAATLALVFVLGIALAIYLKHPGSTPSVVAPPSEPAPPNADAFVKAPAPAQPTSPVLSTPPAQPAPSAAPAAQAKPADTLPEDAQHAVMLESLGGLSAANLYQSYLNLGLLAEGVESESFTIDGAASTLKIVANCLTLVDGKLAKLDRKNLDPEDQDSLERIKAVTQLLRMEARVLLAYWLTGAPEQSANHRLARAASWKGLSRVLGLDAE